MYLEYGPVVGICSAFQVMATFTGKAVRTDAALTMVLPSVFHLAGRFDQRGRPALLLHDDGRLHHRAFLGVTALPKLRRSERQCGRAFGCSGWTGCVVNGPS